MMAISSIFGRTLVHLRLAAGFTQEELAARSGLSVRGISDLERGARSRPRLETVRLLADALNLSPDDRTELLAAARSSFAAEQIYASQPRSWSAVHLPDPLTSLIGRDAEVDNLRQLISRPEVRLVTLTGPGGIGKTRLALAVARAVAPEFADGAAFVDLAPVRDPALVTSTVAAELGIREDATPMTALQDALKDCHLLLVLDNFEQVTSAAPVVADLLRTCPHLKIFVTSRARLHLRGEIAVPVSPLNLPDRAASTSFSTVAASDAVRLFSERATEVRPGFSLSSDNVAAVAEICRRLDGLPLAIELAAARTNVLLPVELLARLEPRLPMLRGGPVDQPDRLRTMRDAIVWSLDLLSSDERHLFARLAVFSGGCSLAAVEAIWADAQNDDNRDVPPRSAVDILGALVDQSLVQTQVNSGGETRFLMLETIKEVAGQILFASGQHAETANRHATFFGDLAERAYADFWGTRQSEWIQRLETDHANLRAAIDWLSQTGQIEPLLRLTGALGTFWLIRGYASEGRATLERALAGANDGCVEPVTLARALIQLAILLAEQGEFDPANEVLERARVIRLELGDRAGIGHVLSWFGSVAESRGDDAVALQRYREAWEVIRETTDDSLMSFALANLSDTAYRQGDLSTAALFARDALAAARTAGEAIGTIVALNGFAQMELAEGRIVAAVTALHESLAMSLDTGYLSGIGDTLGLFAAVARATSQPRVALNLLSAAVGVRKTSGVHRFLHQHQFDITLESIQRELDPVVFAEAWAYGQTPTLAEALELVESIQSSGTTNLPN